MNAAPPILSTIATTISAAPPARSGGMTVWMRGASPWVANILPTLLTLLMAWLDYETGWEVSLFIFYAVPIVMSVWWAGPKSGIVMVVFSGVVWWVANHGSHPYETSFGYAWALINRLFYFGVVVFAVGIVRNKQDADARHIRMLEERRQMEQDIVRVSEHEQQRIGQDLHDGLCQQLAAIGLAVRALADDLKTRDTTAAHDADQIEESIQQAVLEARSLARGIFPVHVDRAGLSPALQDLARSTSRLTGVKIEVRELAEVQIEHPDTAMHLYRIAQEAVANGVRHGGAQHIIISLLISGSSVELRIEDDGTGMPDFSAAAARPRSGGMGLRTMRYRAQMLGAHLEILPRTGGGTCVSCRLPLLTQTEPQTWPLLKTPPRAD